MLRSSLYLLAVLSLAACSAGTPPPGRDPSISGADGGAVQVTYDGATSRPDPMGCVPSAEGTPETCSDGLDNDCNGRHDCSDPECSGVGACPVCGRVDTPLGAPLALPDGIGDVTCASDPDCPSGQRCFEIGGFLDASNECRESYRSTLSFVGFGGATFDAVSDIVSLCVVMEHSWLRDLEITLEAPNGASVRLQRFLGQEGDEIYLGQANDCDESGAPSPGTGARYCWTPSAGRAAMLDYANMGGALDSGSSCMADSVSTMPPGDYGAAEDWSNLIGAPLNGDWTLSVTDLWPEDNGYLFEWSIAFDPGTVEDCGSPLI